MGSHRRARANVIALTMALSGLGVLAGCTNGGKSAASPTAPAARATTAPDLLRAARAALRSGGPVHLDLSLNGSTGSVSYSTDSTASGGRQVVTKSAVVIDGKTVRGPEHLTILLIAGIGYVQADAQGLEDLGLPKQQAERLKGKWISLRPGEKLGKDSYAKVTAGITLSSVASELMFRKGTLTRTAPTTVAGRRVIGVQTPLDAGGSRAVLYLTDNALRRPVLSKPVGYFYKERMSFSRWGETPHLTPPATAIPAPSLGHAPSAT